MGSECRSAVTDGIPSVAGAKRRREERQADALYIGCGCGRLDSGSMDGAAVSPLTYALTVSSPLSSCAGFMI